MTPNEKKQVLKVASLLREMGSAWLGLPTDVQELVIDDLKLLNPFSIKELAGRLEGCTKGYDGVCEFCGKPFTSKKRGLTQRFCSTNCRVQGNNKAKRDRQDRDREERDRLANEWLAGL